MSATEILEELPNLSAAELETIYRRAMELRHGQMVEPTPQLPAEREKKTTRPRRASRLAERWAGKFRLPKPDPSDPRLTYLIERYFRNRS